MLVALLMVAPQCLAPWQVLQTFVDLAEKDREGESELPTGV